MKKLLSLVLLLTLSFTFSACGDSDDEEEKFVWGGDWNDPDDPNYKPEYGGKYNPIQGLWRFDWDTERGVYFSEDFIAYDAYFYPNGLHKIDLSSADKYEINDKAYKTFHSGIFRYIIEGDKLRYTYHLDEEKGWGYSTKVEE